MISNCKNTLITWNWYDRIDYLGVSYYTNFLFKVVWNAACRLSSARVPGTGMLVSYYFIIM